MLFQQLDRHIAVGLNGGLRQVVLVPEQPVVVEHPVVGQGKAGFSGLAGKGVVVPVVQGVPLGGHAGMSHDHPGVTGKGEA